MIYSILYVIAFSFGGVLIQKLYSTIPPSLSLFATSSLATLYFNLINFKKIPIFYRSCWEQKWLCLGIMITVLIMWNCSMTGPGLIGTSLYHFLYFTWLGTLGYVFLSFSNWQKYYYQLSCGLLAFFLVAIVSGSYLLHTHSTQAAIGVILAIIGGSSAFIYFKQSQKLISKIKISSTQILAVRFYLTILIMATLFPKNDLAQYMNLINGAQLFLLAALTLIIPLYFQQKALEIISSELNSIIISLSPISMALIEEITFHDVNFYYVIIYFVYTLIVASSYLLKNQMARKEI